MNELEERYNTLKVDLDGRDLSNVGTKELATLRDTLASLLNEIDRVTGDYRKNDTYSNDEVVKVLTAAGELRSKASDLRTDVVVELLYKEATIKNLQREKSQIENLENAFAGFSVVDPLNLTSIETSVKNLTSAFPTRKQEIDEEIGRLENGVEKELAKKLEPVPEIKNTIDGVDFSEEEHPVEVPSAIVSGDEALNPLTEIETPSESDGLLPIPEMRSESSEVEAPKEETNSESEGLLPIPEMRSESSEVEAPKEETPSGPDGLLPIPEMRSESPEVEAPKEETNSEEDGLLPIPEKRTVESEKEAPSAATEEKNDDAILPIPVSEVVQPKDTLWQKIDKAIKGAIAFMAVAITVHTGLGAHYLKNMSTNEATIQEQDDLNEENKEEEVVKEENINNSVAPQEEPSPATIVQEEQKHEEKKEEQSTPELDIPIYLEQGESVYDTTTGVEVTSTGDSYYHDNGGSVQIESRNLEQNNSGQAIVTNQDFQYTPPAAAPAAPVTPPPVAQTTPDVAPENIVDADTHAQELIAAGNLSEAEAFEQARNDIDWDSILGPSM